jgi:hypothetical protein
VLHNAHLHHTPQHSRAYSTTMSRLKSDLLL